MQDVIGAAVAARALQCEEVGHVFNYAKQAGVTLRVGADGTERALGKVAAALAASHNICGLP